MKLARNISISVVVWLSLTCGVAFVTAHTNLWRYYILSERGVAVSGTIIDKQPQNHRFVRYSYSVAGRSFERFGRVGDGNSDFDSLKVGDEINVFVDPKDPETAVVGSPKSWFRNELLTVGIATVVFPLLITIVLLAKGVLPPWKADATTTL